MSGKIPTHIMERLHFIRGVHYARYKVSYSLQNCDDYLYFGSFGRIDRDDPSTKGNGAKALKELCESMDYYRIPMELFTEYKKLVPYYQRFGFVIKEAEDNCHCVYSRHDGYWKFRREPVVIEKPVWIRPVSRSIPIHVS